MVRYRLVWVLTHSIVWLPQQRNLAVTLLLEVCDSFASDGSDGTNIGYNELLRYMTVPWRGGLVVAVVA